ncbi:MAG: glycoside hydrolase family 92 protein, partial [Acidobacteria bacterium]|nr:glycoside hydrolase family 92 protein [Acidobacteriota bacterium]
MKSPSVVLTILLMITGLRYAVPAHQPVVSRIQPAADLPTRDKVDLAEYVNPFVGTDGAGNTFPGAALPFGMMQWSPDTTANGFYKYRDSKIRGFSLTHLSGAGCPIFADIPLLPTVEPIKNSPATSMSDYAQGFSHSNEQAAPGYYSVNFNSGIQVKLSVTARTGLGVFMYPSTEEANLLINAGGSATGNSMSSVQVVGNDRVIGSAMSGTFCGTNTVYTIYFAVQFDRPFKSFGTWNAGAVNPGLRSSTSKQPGAFLTFDTSREPTVKAKVGISFVSVENALLNLKTENSGWDFDAVRWKAHATWNDWLSRIKVDGSTREEKEIFYTALYHSLLSPNVFSDANGEYIGFDRLVHKANGYKHYTNISDWAVRIFLGRDTNGKRKYFNKTIHGTKKDAQKYLTAKLREKDLGVFIEPASMSLNEYLDKWLSESAKPRLREATLDSYQSLLQKHVREKLGSRKLSDIKPLDVQKLYNRMTENLLSPRTVRYVHTILKSAFSQAIKWQMLSVNPCSIADLPRQQKNEMKAFSPEQAKRFLEAAKDSKHGLVFAFALASGMRPEEYLALKWSDIDFEKHTATVQRTLIWRKGGGWYFSEPKTVRSRRTLPLPESLLLRLKTHKRQQAEAILKLCQSY